jgi:multidrug transporter EmrE-like cation transporter
MPPLIPFVIAVTISAVGNILLKFGTSQIGGVTLKKENLIGELFKVFLNPFIFVGLSGYVLGFFVWMKVLSSADVSRAYPALVSSTIILVLLGSALFLKEQLSVIKIVGILTIIFGIYLIFKN